MAGEGLDRLLANVERVLYGKRRAVELVVAGLLAEGHVLLEDVPGTGKTTLARALARSLDLEFRRIQFTADLLPSDVVGVSVPDPATGEFRFRPGPVFGNVVLADELNRTTPRTQSALLECMNETRVTVDGVTHELPRPFLVVATQNPMEFEGTYPLPESQLDRFLLRVRIGHAGREAERRVLLEGRRRPRPSELDLVLTAAEARTAIQATQQVRLDPAIADYVLDLVEATRTGSRFLLGLSTRAAESMCRAARAWAAIHGRDHVVPDDVKELAVPVFAHRVVVAPTPSSAGGAGRADGAALHGEAESAIRRVLETATVPD